jgi:hypothetical protein
MGRSGTCGGLRRECGEGVCGVGWSVVLRAEECAAVVCVGCGDVCGLSCGAAGGWREAVRVLTVRQPWAWAIVYGGKESRTPPLAGCSKVCCQGRPDMKTAVV